MCHKFPMSNFLTCQILLPLFYCVFLTKIDVLTFCSRKHGDKNPVWFTLGLKEVLKGWDKGLQNMCAGERRKLTIPPSLGYGKEGQGNQDYLKNKLTDYILALL